MKKLSYELYVEENDVTWFMAYDHNGLYKKSRDKEIELVCVVPWESEYDIRLYSSMIKIENKIFLIPFKAKSIAVYNVDTNEISEVVIKKNSEFACGLNGNDSAKFWSVVEKHDELILFPHNYSSIVTLNTKTLEVTYDERIVSFLDGIKNSGEPYITDVFKKEDFYYCSVGCANVIIRFEKYKLDFDILELNIQNYGSNGIYVDDEYIWIAPRYTNPIISYEFKTKKTNKYDKFPKGFKCGYVPFHTIYRFKNKLIFLPALADMAISLDLSTYEISNEKSISDIITKNREESAIATDMTMAYSYDCPQISFVSCKDNVFYTIDLQNGDIKSCEHIINDKHICENNITKALSTDNIGVEFIEDERVTLSRFISFVKGI